MKLALLVNAASTTVICNNASALGQLLSAEGELNCTASGILGTLNQNLRQAVENGTFPLYEVGHLKKNRDSPLALAGGAQMCTRCSNHRWEI